MIPVGYLTKYEDRLVGDRGQIFDYVLAKNGLFIEAEGRWLAARVMVAGCEIRGLSPLKEQVVLRYGKIPKLYFDLALGELWKVSTLERFVAITYNQGYHVTVPEQLDGAIALEYQNPDKVVVDLHSHGTMPAFFSQKDDKDDLGFKIFGVVGQPAGGAQLLLRVGVYGYHTFVPWSDIFEDECPIIDRFEEDEIPEEDIPEEVNNELSSDAGVLAQERRSNWVRWYRRICGRRPVPGTEK